MDIKVYDDKVRELQGYLPFLENLMRNMANKPSMTERLQKFEQLHKLIMDTKRGHRIEMNTVMRVENTIREIKKRCEAKVSRPHPIFLSFWI